VCLDDIENINIMDMAVGNNQDMGDQERAQMPLFARADIPVVHESSNTTLPSHFYLNQGLHLMRRKLFHSNPVTHPVLNHIVSRISGNPIGLAYPEGLLFPMIFWDTVTETQSVTGALPSFMFYGQGKSEFAQNLGSLNEHLKVRVRDKFSHTSRTPAYLHFAFDVLINTAFQSISPGIFRDKGLEFMPQVKNMGKSYETAMSFDEVTASQKRKELAHLIREGKWHYFVTLTCNDALSPGVSEITRAMEDCYWLEDKETALRMMQEYQSILITSWERTVNLFFDYLLESKEGMVSNLDTVCNYVKFINVHLLLVAWKG
jgi:hypothetical protein